MLVNIGDHEINYCEQIPLKNQTQKLNQLFTIY